MKPEESNPPKSRTEIENWELESLNPQIFQKLQKKNQKAKEDFAMEHIGIAANALTKPSPEITTLLQSAKSNTLPDAHIAAASSALEEKRDNEYLEAQETNPEVALQNFSEARISAAIHLLASDPQYPEEPTYEALLAVENPKKHLLS